MYDGFLIREFRFADLPDIVEIEDESFSDPWKREVFIDLLGSTELIFFVAEQRKKVVGYVAGEVERVSCRRPHSESGKKGHVMNIAVRDLFRRFGIGTRLMMTLEDSFRNQGVKRVELEVRSTNVSAQRLYRKLGYVTKSKIPLYYGNEDAIVMEKTLG